MSESEFTVIIDERLVVIVMVWRNLEAFKSLLWEEKVENIACSKKEIGHTRSEIQRKIHMIKTSHFGKTLVVILSANC